MHMQVNSLLKKTPKQQQDRGAGGRVESRDMCLVALSQAQCSAKRLCPRFHLAAAWESRNAAEAHSHVPLASPGLRGAALPSPPAACRGSERWPGCCYCPGTCWCAEGRGGTLRLGWRPVWCSVNLPLTSPDCSAHRHETVRWRGCVAYREVTQALPYSNFPREVSMSISSYCFLCIRHFFSLKDFCF